MFHYIDGGADDEVTLRPNTDPFEDYEIQPLLWTQSLSKWGSLLGKTV